MNNVSKYIRDARSRVHEEFSNADGFIDDDLRFTANEDFFGANGQGAPAPQSQPYIINITSTSGAAVSNFDVLGSYEYMNNSGWSSGSLVVGSVTISSAIPNVTYREMLYQFMNAPFSVGLTYISSTTTNQVLQPFSINTKDANGNYAQKPFVPTFDPYQNLNTVIAVKQGYRIDGYTKLIFSNILANATVSLYLYPADNINLARGLAGQPVSRAYGNPGIIKAQPVKIIGG